MQKIMERSWIWRRWAVFSSLAVCDAAIVYLMIFGDDTALSRDIIQSAFLTILALVNGYVFGAVLDDKNKDKAAIAQSAVDAAAPSNSTVTTTVDQ